MMTIFLRIQNEKMDIKGCRVHVLVHFLIAIGRFKSLILTELGEILGENGLFTS